MKPEQMSELKGQLENIVTSNTRSPLRFEYKMPPPTALFLKDLVPS